MPNDDIKSAKDFAHLIRRVRNLADSVRGKDNDEIDFVALREDWRNSENKRTNKPPKRKSKKRRKK